MKKIIYYFSGTGNSLYTAKKIAEKIDGAKLVSVRCNPNEVSAEDADVIGFVCPVYEWDVPGSFKEFIEKLNLNSNAYIFMVTTYIFILGKSFETVESILNKKGCHLDYGNTIRCVASHCIAYPPFPPEKIMIPYMEMQMNKVGTEIKCHTKRKYPKMSVITRKRFDKVMIPFLKLEHEYDTGFYTDDRCKGCGICAKVCPTSNILITENKPVWNHKCHGCNSCVVYCPTKAIQFKIPEAHKQLKSVIVKLLRLPEKRKRYHHPKVFAKDLMIDKQDFIAF